MKIDIAHIAKLARLKIEPERFAKFEKEMESILDMVENLPPIEGKLLPDASHPMELRPDEIHPSFRRESILQNAPQVEAGCFVVPKVVE